MRHCLYGMSLLLAIFFTVNSHGLMPAARDQVVLVITYGQSLSLGSSDPLSAGVSTTPEYPWHVLTLDSGDAQTNSVGWLTQRVRPDEIRDFTPLVQLAPKYESPTSGALNALVARNLRTHGRSPRYLSISGGSGGRSLIELMIRPKDKYTSVARGLKGTSPDTPFMVKTNGSTRFYINKNGTAVEQSTRGPEPFYFENVIAQIKVAQAIAKKKGLRIHPEVIMIWTQGTADSNTSEYRPLFANLLKRMRQNIKQQLNVGTDFRLTTFISQTRGSGNRARAIDQLEVAQQTPNTIVASQESWLNIAFPAISLIRSVHLSKPGYRVMGEQIGNAIFERFETNYQGLPTIDSYELNGNVLKVRFANVHHSLAENTESHQHAGLPVAPHFGFEFYSETGSAQNPPEITSSRISGNQEVELTLSSRPESAVYLYLGRNSTRATNSSRSNLLGTTLVDTQSDQFIGTPQTGSLFIGNSIPHFLPIQRVLIEPQ